MIFSSDLVATATVSFLLGWTLRRGHIFYFLKNRFIGNPPEKLKLAIVVRTDLKMSPVGDSGVGKTSLIHLICHNEAIASPSWTVGCSVEVKLHEFREGLPQQKTYFVELWDIGGSSSHQNSRSIFYNPVNGIILVHDLTNRKSQQNLQKWLSEILNYEADGKVAKSFDEFDSEQFVGSTQIPILVVGTKLDLSGSLRSQKMGTFAEECGADEILMDCRQPSALAAGKIASQCSHATLACYKQGLSVCPDVVKKWESLGQPKVILRSNSGAESLNELGKKASKAGLVSILIRDAGRTQVPAGSTTALGIGPDNSIKIDEITSDLKLL